MTCFRSGLMAIAIVSSILLLANRTDAQSTAAAKSEDAVKNQLRSILTEQTKAWNEGNLEKFMTTYWKSEKLTFSGGGKTTYGWQATLEKYRTSYAPPKEMGKLHFDGLEISMIESNSALILGNWHLRMKGGEERDGNFSLVLKKFESGWKIIHDHSSTRDPEEPQKPAAPEKRVSQPSPEQGQ